MKVFAIGDLHLSGKNPKPMEIFGDNWAGHFEKIATDWQTRVSDEDLVLICGDISWAMKFEDAIEDLNNICSLNGNKLLLRGNHDYWWSSVSRLRGVLFNNTYVLQNDCAVFGDIAVAGTRGWTVPGENRDLSPEDKKIYLREVERLKLSLSDKKNNGKKLIGIMHFPPFNEKKQDSEFTKLFSEAGVTDVVYGHLHGEWIKHTAPVITKGNVNYHITSCDYLNFKLKQIV